MGNTEEKVLIVSAVPSLGWKAARSLAQTGRAVYFAGPRGLPGREWMPYWRRYYELHRLRWADRDRVDPVVLEEIGDLCRELEIDVVVPSDWPTTVLLGESERAFGRRPFAIAPIDTLLSLHDKWEFSRLLHRIGVPQPRTLLGTQLAELAEMRFPVLTKPRNSSNSRGIVVHPTATALRQHVAGMSHGELSQTIVQEFIGGEDVTVTILADRGRLVGLGAALPKRWRRLFFRNPDLQAMVERIVAESGYHGPGHFDFRTDAERRNFWAIECNPRLNGSVVYFARAGLNVVDLALRLSNLEQIEGVSWPRSGLRLLEPSDIATGVYMTALMHAARRGLLPAHLVQRQVPERVSA